MPVRNDADDGTIYAVGRPRPTATIEIETAALFSSGIAAAAFAIQLAQCGASAIGTIGLLAALTTFGLLAYDVGRRAGVGKGATARSAKKGSFAFTPDFSSYDFGPFIVLGQKETEPLPPDFGPTFVVVFYNLTGTTFRTWITGVPDATTMIRFLNNLAKNSAGDPDYLSESP